MLACYASDYRQGGVKVYSSLDYKAANAQTQNSLVHDARFTEDNYRTILGRLLCLLLAARPAPPARRLVRIVRDRDDVARIPGALQVPRRVRLAPLHRLQHPRGAKPAAAA